LDDVPAFDLVVQKKTIEISGERNVAAATQNAQIGFLQLLVLVQFMKIGNGLNGKIFRRANFKAEGIEREQVLILGYFHE
jgi:hypothetical protein